MSDELDRESPFERAARTLRAKIEAVRRVESLRNRAVLVLAQHHAEAVGYRWDTLPWRDNGVAADQSYYVMHACDDVDVLIAHGFVDAEIPPEAVEDREAHRVYGHSIGASWPELSKSPKTASA